MPDGIPAACFDLLKAIDESPAGRLDVCTVLAVAENGAWELDDRLVLCEQMGLVQFCAWKCRWLWGHWKRYRLTGLKCPCHMFGPESGFLPWDDRLDRIEHACMMPNSTPKELFVMLTDRGQAELARWRVRERERSPSYVEKADSLGDDRERNEEDHPSLPKQAAREAETSDDAIELRQSENLDALARPRAQQSPSGTESKDGGVRAKDRIDPTKPDPNGYVAEPADPSSYVQVATIHADYCNDTPLTTIKAITKVLEDFPTNGVRWTRPPGTKTGRPHPQRRSVHLVDWQNYVKRLKHPRAATAEKGFPDMSPSEIEARKLSVRRNRHDGK